MKGIDVSRYQSGLAMKDVKKAGNEFVILRGGVTGYGSSRIKQKDTLFESFYSTAKAAGLAVGAYWYSCAKTKAEGVDEATFLYNNCLKGKTFEMPIYIDVENTKWQMNDKAGVTDAIIGFCDYLEKKGYYVGVYSSLSWFNTYIDTKRLDKYSKWLACWTAKKPDFKYSNFDLWQNSDSGKIGRFTVDTDVCYKDFPSIIKAAGKNGFKKPLKSIAEIAKEVIDGKWGNGEARKKKLTEAGYDYAKVQAKVNELLNTSGKKSITEIAKECIAGKWGNGAVRKNKLTKSGYNYAEVQKKVNELLKLTK